MAETSIRHRKARGMTREPALNVDVRPEPSHYRNFVRRCLSSYLLHINRDEVSGCRRLRRAGGAGRMQQQRNQGGPTGLMRGTQAAAGVAVKILVKQHIVAEANIGLLDPRVPEDRSPTLLVAQKDLAQTPGKLIGHFAKVKQPA